MAEFLSYIKNVSNTFWGTDVFQWLFFGSAVVILRLEKNSAVKRMLGIYPLMLLLAICNPVMYLIMQKMELSWQYYARPFTMLPLPYVLALGMTLFLKGITAERRDSALQCAQTAAGPIESEKTRTAFVRTAFLLIICALFVYGGTNVYEQDWMARAQNVSKVPDEAIWICNELQNEEDVTIAVPESLSSYIRQVGPSLYTPYGRYVNALGEELSKQNPDPEYAMTEAGKNGCDYIVVSNSAENIDSFAEKGWREYRVVGNYLLYRVSNVPMTKRTHDENRFLRALTTLDECGRPSPDANGCTSITYDYDERGNRTRETYLDARGDKVLMPGGYASVRRSYTRFSRQIETLAYLDAADQPILKNGRCETRFEYNARREPVRETYYDEAGRAVERRDIHCASATYQYDGDGRFLGYTYCDSSGKPVMTPCGYASYRMAFDEDNRFAGMEYFDAQGRRLGGVAANESPVENSELFRFLHCVQGVEIDDGNAIIMDTGYSENVFSHICFQLYEAQTDAYCLDFGKSWEPGETAGKYTHRLPDGLYYIVLKGNTNRFDSRIRSMAYLRRGDVLDYRYEVECAQAHRIVIRNARVSKQVGQDQPVVNDPVGAENGGRM